MLRLRRRLRQAAESFWFIPVLCVLVAIAAAELLVGLDRWLRTHEFHWWGSTALQFGVDGSRGLLSAIGGGTFGAAATAFSITISVIVTASTSYGPRLVGNFMADRRNQLTLGVLVSTFVYTILVSRWLRSELEDGSAFVPRVAVLVALGLALTNVFLLISFLHHMAASTRVGAIIDTAATKFRQVARTSFEEVPDSTTDATVPVGGWVVTSTRSGYVGAIDLARLVAAARDARVWVVLEVGIGDRLHPGSPVARTAHHDEDIEAALRAAIELDRSRQIASDVRFAQSQVIEVAVRALSSGTNDPATAVNAIDELATGMVELVEYPIIHGAITDPDDGATRVFWRPASLGDLIDAPFEQCEPYLPADHAVLGALLSMAWKIEAANHHPEFAGRALGHAKRIVAFARDNLSSLQADALEEIDARSRELFELSRTADAQERQQAAEESSTAH